MVRRKFLGTKSSILRWLILLFVQNVLFFSAVYECSEEELARAKDDFRIVGYVPEYRQGSVDWPSVLNLLTDVVFFSIESSETGELINLDRLPNGAILKLAAEAKTNTLFTVGGGGRSQGLAVALKNNKAREALIDNCWKLVEEYGFDGVDIDWEIPQSDEDYENLAKFLRGLRDVFTAKSMTRKLVTMAIHPGQEPLLVRHQIIKVVDWVSEMVYDNLCFYPKTPPPCKHSTLEFSELIVRHLRGAIDIDESKILLGIPFYGRHTMSGEAKTYSELVGSQPDFDYQADEIDSYYFNSVSTLREKIDLVLESPPLGGVMLWEVGQDVDPKEEDISLLSNLAAYVKLKGTSEGSSRVQSKRLKKRLSRSKREHEGKNEL